MTGRWIKEGEKRICPFCMKSRESKPNPSCPQYHWDGYRRVRERSNDWRRKNRERYNEMKKMRDPYHLYRMTNEQLQEKLQSQDGKCAICKRNVADYQIIEGRNVSGTDYIQKRRRYFIDHDHKNGINRGLLCNKCNFMIGYADESLETLRAAIDYLTKWNDFVQQRAKLNE